MFLPRIITTQYGWRLWAGQEVNHNYWSINITLAWLTSISGVLPPLTSCWIMAQHFSTDKSLLFMKVFFKNGCILFEYSNRNSWHFSFIPFEGRPVPRISIKSWHFGQLNIVEMNAARTSGSKHSTVHNAAGCIVKLLCLLPLLPCLPTPGW